MFAKLLAALLLASSVALADNTGIALYGIQHKDFPCGTAIKAFEGVPEIRIAFLWNTFGTELRCLNEFANIPRLKAIQIHLINEVCQRNKRCGSYEFLRGLSLDEFRQRLVQKDQQFLARLHDYFDNIRTSFVDRLPGGVDCFISPGLESNLDEKSAKVLVEEARRVFGARCQIVFNPAGINRFQGKAGADLFESHGSSPKLSNPCIANLDGEDISFPNRPSLISNSMPESQIPGYESRYQGCAANFLWITEMNGVCRGGFVDPRRRTCWPTSYIASRLNRALGSSIATTPQEAPASADLQGCKYQRANDGRGGFVWKESDTKKNRKGELVAIVLLPSRLAPKRVSLYQGNKELERLSFVYKYTEDGSNRSVWRTETAPKNLARGLTLKADEICFKLDDPQHRID